MWIKDLTARERRTLWACAAGWGLDGFDMTLFSYVITGLISIHMLTKPQAGVLGTAALLSSSLGGWLAGILCDRYGRVRVLQMTIAWFAVFTFLCGFAQNYAQMFVLRGLQGLGFGGEWTAGAVLMGEVIRAQYRGRAVGTVQAGVGIGYTLAAVSYGVVFSFMPVDWAWRTLFWMGVLPALLVVYVRRYVEEPEIYRQTKTATRVELFGFLKGRVLLVRTLVALTMMSGLQGSYYVVATWLPQFLKGERHMSVVGTSGYTALVLIGSFFGFLIGAHFADYFGRRPTVIFFSIGNAIAAYAYTVIPVGPGMMMFLGMLMGAMSSGRFAPLGPILTELYPTAIRGTAQGFVYNGGRAIGALSPAIAGYASAHMKLGTAIGVLAVLWNGIAVFACFFLPETRNKELSSDGGEQYERSNKALGHTETAQPVRTAK
jgi:MFS family permease